MKISVIVRYGQSTLDSWGDGEERAKIIGAGLFQDGYLDVVLYDGLPTGICEDAMEQLADMQNQPFALDGWTDRKNIFITPTREDGILWTEEHPDYYPYPEPKGDDVSIKITREVNGQGIQDSIIVRPPFNR